MTRVSLAELVLGMTLPQDRAAAVAGDLTETAKGPSRFWVAVVETTAASCWKTIMTSPRQIGQLTGRVFLKFVSLQFLFTLLFFGAILVILIVKNATGLAWMLWLPGTVEVIGRGIVLPYMVGRWTSQREPRNAVAAIVAFYGAMLLLSVLSLAMGWSFVAPSGVRMEVWTMFVPLPGVVFTLIGAARERWNGLQAG